MNENKDSCNFFLKFIIKIEHYGEKLTLSTDEPCNRISNIIHISFKPNTLLNQYIAYNFKTHEDKEKIESDFLSNNIVFDAVFDLMVTISTGLKNVKPDASHYKDKQIIFDLSNLNYTHDEITKNYKYYLSLSQLQKLDKIKENYAALASETEQAIDNKNKITIDKTDAVIPIELYIDNRIKRKRKISYRLKQSPKLKGDHSRPYLQNTHTPTAKLLYLTASACFLMLFSWSELGQCSTVVPVDKPYNIGNVALAILTMTLITLACVYFSRQYKKAKALKTYKGLN